MKAVFYYNTSEANKVDKDLRYITEIDIVFKTAVSLKNLIIDVQLKFENNLEDYEVVDSDNENIVVNGDDLLVDTPFNLYDFNYCYIPVLKRYYFISNPILITPELVRLELAEDVLMSFKNEFRLLDAFISRNEFDFNTMIRDDLYPFQYNKEVVVEEVTNIYPVKEFQQNNLYNNCVVAYLTSEYIYKSIGQFGEPRAYLFGNNLSTQYWVTPIDNLRTMANELFTDDIALGYVKNIKIYPFEIEDVDIVMFKNSINIGGKTISLQAEFSYPKSPYYKIKIASFDLPKFNSFRDFPPYSNYELWIPYYGWISLNADNISDNETIEVYYTVNFENGNSTVYVTRNFDEILFSAPVQLGVTVALSSTNARELENEKISTIMNGTIGLVGSAIQVGTGIFSGNPVAAAMGVMNATKTIGSVVNNFNTMYEKANANVSSASDGILNPQKCYIKTTYVVSGSLSGNKYDKWKHLYGRPLNDIRNLSELTGFTQIGDINLENVQAYENEKIELYDLLKNGIIL